MTNPICVCAFHTPLGVEAQAVVASSQWDQIPAAKDVLILSQESWANALKSAIQLTHRGDGRFVSAALAICERHDDLAMIVETIEGICRASHHGQVVFTKSLAEHAQRGGKDSISIGTYLILGTSMELFQAPSNGTFPPLRINQRGNILKRTTPFFGRHDELNVAVDTLAAANVLVITGQAGSGKSSLAVRIATEVAGNYEDGTWLFPAHCVNNAGDILKICAPLVGVFRDDEEGFEGLLAKSALVILDDLPVVETAIEILRRAVNGTRLQFIITSQSRESADALQLDGVEVGDGPDAPATQLFLSRCQSARNLENRHAEINALCRNLEGHPRSIEIAATSIRTASDLEEWRQRTRELGPLLDDPSSLQLAGISAVARRLLEMACVFECPWPRSAVSENASHESLQELLDCGAIEMGCTEFGEVLFLVPLVLRQGIARDQFPDDLQNAQQGRREFVLSQCSDAAQPVDNTHLLAGVSRSYADWIGVLDELILAGRKEYESVYYTLAEHWHRRGPLSDALSLTKVILDRFDDRPPRVTNVAGTLHLSRGNYDIARKLLRTAAHEASTCRDYGTLAAAHANLAVVERHVGNLENAVVSARESCDTLRGLGQAARLSKALNNYGCILEDLGRFDEAILVFDECSALSEESGNTWHQLKVLCNKAELSLRGGRLETSLDLCRHSFVLANELGDHFARGRTLRTLAACYDHGGEAELAAMLLGASYDALRQSAMAESPLAEKAVDQLTKRLENLVGQARFASLWRTGMGLVSAEISELTRKKSPKV